MLSIARALMGNPRLLLLDEPTEGLAPLVVEKLEARTMKLREQGISTLLAEQNVKSVLLTWPGAGRCEPPLSSPHRDVIRSRRVSRGISSGQTRAPSSQSRRDGRDSALRSSRRAREGRR